MAFVRAYSPAPRKVVYLDESEQKTTYSGGSRAWRTQNPGNIVRGRFADAHGAIGDDGVNAIFPSEESGRSALVALLRTSTYQRLTVAGTIERYAPASDGNDPEQYQRFVRSQTGLDLARVMNTLNEEELQALRSAIEKMEGWRPGDIVGHAAPHIVPPRAAAHHVQDWMRIAIAESELPERERSEWPDPGENPRIINYFRSTFLNPMTEGGDEVDWCAAFVNHCLETAGHDGTDHPGARSFAWENWGVRLEEPVYGCIAVFQNLPNPDPAWRTGQGHVGFVVEWDAQGVTLLGGNQSKTVKKAYHRYSTSNRKLYCYKLPRIN